MGIAKAAFRLLLQEKKRGHLTGETLLQLGRQHTFLTYSLIQKLAGKHGVALSPVKEVKPSFNPELAERGFIDDTTLFEALGFGQVESLDVSPYEEATFVEDLNKPIPEKYWGKYDVIFDGGTAEHIFDFPQVLRNIHLLLKENGVIIHLSPSHNHVDHGFYMFSPTLFSEYYRANQYSILTSNIYQYSKRHDKDPWIIYSYEPGCLDAFSFGGFGKELLGIFMVAKKTEHSTSDVVPQQGYYHTQWSGEKRIGRKTLIQRIASKLPKGVKRTIKAMLPSSLRKRRIAKY